jgi:GAF domain-containing protein
MTLNDRDETIRQLLDVARKNELSALQEMLRVIAQHAHAIGAVIWEVVQARNVAEQDRRLMVLGSWFENPDDGVWYYLTLEKSLTGQTIARKQPYFSETVGTESLTPQKAKKTLQSMGFKTSLLVPVDLTQFNTKACINFYWKSEIALDKAAQKEIASICSLLPDLYAALVDRVGLKLLQSLNRTLRQKKYSAKYSAKDAVGVQPQDAVQHALQEVVTLISNVFNCREVCIFLLNERGQDRTSVVLKAKYWEWEDPPLKIEYEEGVGLTGYTLKTKERVRIHDLVFFDEDYPYISGNYPGIQWDGSEVLQKSARVLLKLPPEADLPPISFMAVPIFGGGQLLGVIRCCAARNAPYFFDNRQVDVLKLAADSLGVWRQDWLDRAQTDVENEDWREVMQKLAYLNGFVHSELTQRSPNESKILKAAMQATADLIADTPALDVRLRKDNHLYVAETSGDLWDKGSWTEKEQRKSRIFSLAEGARKSAAALVYKTKKLHVVESPADEDYDATFPEVKKAILAPLVCGKDIYGTLGVRRVTDVPFAEHEKVVVELLANQLGLYHFLADEISELNKTKETLQSTVDSQTRMYEVFGHQVRSPIVQQNHSRRRR